MSQPLTNIGMFYKQLGDFKDKIITILGQFDKQAEIVELHKYYDKLCDAKKINIRLPIELFHEHGVEKYTDDILKRNETIFLKTVSEIITKEEIGEKQDIMFISHIKEIWTKLQPNVKENIWIYIQVISLLAEKVTGKNVYSSRKEQLKKEGLIK
jgi:hypothetical protein